jgi:hypothetical protein
VLTAAAEPGHAQAFLVRENGSTVRLALAHDEAMASITWDSDTAGLYDAINAAEADPAVVGPMVGLLASLAGAGPVLEFAVGTGRIALPLGGRGIAVSGIELSPHMAGRLRAKPGADAVAVTVGDMTSTRVPGTFTLVYLAANTIMNVTTPRTSRSPSSPTPPPTLRPTGGSWWR